MLAGTHVCRPHDRVKHSFGLQLTSVQIRFAPEAGQRQRSAQPAPSHNALQGASSYPGVCSYSGLAWDSAVAGLAAAYITNITDTCHS